MLLISEQNIAVELRSSKKVIFLTGNVKPPYFQNEVLDVVTLHWDGKLLPALST